MRYSNKKRDSVLDVIEGDAKWKRLIRAKKFSMPREEELDLQAKWLAEHKPKRIPAQDKKPPATKMYVHKEILNTAPTVSKCYSCPWAECPDTVAKRNKCSWCMAEHVQSILELWA